MLLDEFSLLTKRCTFQPCSCLLGSHLNPNKQFAIHPELQTIVDISIPKYILAQNKKSNRDSPYLLNILCLYSYGFCRPSDSSESFRNPPQTYAPLRVQVLHMDPGMMTYIPYSLLCHITFTGCFQKVYCLLTAKWLRSPCTMDFHLQLVLIRQFQKY